MQGCPTATASSGISFVTTAFAPTAALRSNAYSADHFHPGTEVHTVATDRSTQPLAAIGLAERYALRDIAVAANDAAAADNNAAEMADVEAGTDTCLSRDRSGICT